MCACVCLCGRCEYKQLRALDNSWWQRDYKVSLQRCHLSVERTGTPRRLDPLRWALGRGWTCGNPGEQMKGLDDEELPLSSTESYESKHRRPQISLEKVTHLSRAHKDKQVQHQDDRMGPTRPCREREGLSVCVLSSRLLKSERWRLPGFPPEQETPLFCPCCETTLHKHVCVCVSAVHGWRGCVREPVGPTCTFTHLVPIQVQKRATSLLFMM